MLFFLDSFGGFDRPVRGIESAHSRWSPTTQGSISQNFAMSTHDSSDPRRNSLPMASRDLEMGLESLEKVPASPIFSHSRIRMDFYRVGRRSPRLGIGVGSNSANRRVRVRRQARVARYGALAADRCVLQRKSPFLANSGGLNNCIAGTEAAKLIIMVATATMPGRPVVMRIREKCASMRLIHADSSPSPT
jgi:hypothetical protein